MAAVAPLDVNTVGDSRRFKSSNLVLPLTKSVKSNVRIGVSTSQLTDSAKPPDQRTCSLGQTGGMLLRSFASNRLTVCRRLVPTTMAATAVLSPPGMKICS